MPTKELDNNIIIETIRSKTNKSTYDRFNTRSSFILKVLDVFITRYDIYLHHSPSIALDWELSMSMRPRLKRDKREQ